MVLSTIYKWFIKFFSLSLVLKSRYIHVAKQIQIVVARNFFGNFASTCWRLAFFGKHATFCISLHFLQHYILNFKFNSYPVYFYFYNFHVLLKLVLKSLCTYMKLCPRSKKNLNLEA